MRRMNSELKVHKRPKDLLIDVNRDGTLMSSVCFYCFTNLKFS